MPWVLPVISIVTTLASAAVSVYSGYQQARQEYRHEATEHDADPRAQRPLRYIADIDSVD